MKSSFSLDQFRPILMCEYCAMLSMNERACARACVRVQLYVSKISLIVKFAINTYELSTDPSKHYKYLRRVYIYVQYIQMKYVYKCLYFEKVIENRKYSSTAQMSNEDDHQITYKYYIGIDRYTQTHTPNGITLLVYQCNRKPLKIRTFFVNTDTYFVLYHLTWCLHFVGYFFLGFAVI